MMLGLATKVYGTRNPTAPSRSACFEAITNPTPDIRAPMATATATDTASYQAERCCPTCRLKKPSSIHSIIAIFSTISHRLTLTVNNISAHPYTSGILLNKMNDDNDS